MKLRASFILNELFVAIGEIAKLFCTIFYFDKFKICFIASIKKKLDT